MVAANIRLTRASARFRDLDPTVLDLVIGTVFTVATLIFLAVGSAPKHPYRPFDALGVLLALGCCLPYYFRRRAPLTVLVVSLASLLLLGTSGYPNNLQSQMILVGAYNVGSHGTGNRRALGLLVIVVGIALAIPLGIEGTKSGDLLLTGVIYVAFFLSGTSIRNRRLYLDELETRAATHEQEREEEAKRAVADERLRIAQELHDVVAHSMGVIAVQAGVGAHVIDDDPDEAKRSLEAIATTSRSTLTEIRRLLGVLRDDGAAGYQPAPGLGDLPLA